MQRVLLIVAIALSTICASGAFAAERPLKGAEIESLLSGNGVTGGSGDTAWTQFFAADGQTAYDRAGSERSRGTWRTIGDKFCSQWPPNESWTCYDVTGDPDATPATITWKSESGKTYPAVVVKGAGL